MTASRVGRVEFEELIRLKMSPREFDLVMEAYRLSKYGHRGQERDNGVRYFEHPKAVALILIQELDIYDSEMLIAALLHDAAEDTYIFGGFEESFKNIQARFGEWVAQCVRLLSKERCRPEEKPERDRRYFENLESADLRALIVKLADRVHNFRDLPHCTQEKKRHYLEETESHYLPLAKDIMRQLPPSLARKIHELYKEMAAISKAIRKELGEEKINEPR